MRPEQTLVLAVCRAHFSGAALEISPSVAEASHVVQLADMHGVLGLVSGYLRRLPNADPLFDAAWRANTARNIMLVSELARLHNALSAVGIRPILLKGPALAKTAFGSYGSRDSCDLDLIVPVDRFRLAINVCTSLGAVVLNAEPLPDDAAKLGAVTLHAPSTPYAIDLHAGWLPCWGGRNRHIDTADLTEIDVGGMCLTFGPVLSLLHASAHFWQHLFSLKGLVDVVATLALARRRGVESDAARRADAMGISETFLYSLRAADEFVSYGQMPSPPGARGVARIATPQKHRSEAWLWESSSFDFGWRSVLAGVARRMFPSADTLRHTPEWVGANHMILRRILRPVRLIARATSSLLAWRRSSWRSVDPLRFGSG